MDLRDGGPYVLSQFIGGMAAPLFLFMAGMTLAFQMDSLERREADPRRRWFISLKRAGYILLIAFAFRLTNFLGSFPNGDAREITKVDILNCMGVAMAVLSVAALFRSAGRARFAAAAGLLIAVAAPIMANLPWDGAPTLLREYLVPGAGRGRFAFFPCASYVGFGLAAGTLVKLTSAERFERLLQWSVLIAFGLIFGAQYFSNLPYSFYSKSNFWTDSPALILIRVGIALLIMAGSYLWTEYCARPGWSWMETLGKTSLMVYWVHVVIVYGSLAKPIKRTMSIPQAALTTLLLTATMVGLSVVWLRWKGWRAARWKTKAAVVAEAAA
jgi:peptidoglycan/LPS O-acetylase OafA/YrhL